MVVILPLHPYTEGEVIEMKFEENLRELRKQKGMSQEELADKLSVSRQAVSKWENGSAYPELDKLMVLCELFHCTMDDLLQGTIKEENKTVSKALYEQHERTFTKAMVIGVSLILFGASCYCYLEPYFLGVKEGILNTFMMGVVTISVLIFVYFGNKNTSFYKKYGKAPLGVYTQEELDCFQQTFNKALVIGIGLILAGVTLYPMIESMSTEALASGSFMILVSIAVGIFIYFGMIKSMYDKTEEDQTISKKGLGKREMFAACIMLIATAIYFLWSFTLQAWEISWVVYPVGGVLCGIVYVVLPEE